MPSVLYSLLKLLTGTNEFNWGAWGICVERGEADV